MAGKIIRITRWLYWSFWKVILINKCFSKSC